MSAAANSYFAASALNASRAYVSPALSNQGGQFAATLITPFPGAGGSNVVGLAARFSSNVTVDGSINASSNVTVGGTLTVNNLTYLYSNITVYAAEEVRSNSVVQGQMTLSNSTGAVVLSTSGGTVAVNSNLAVRGTATLSNSTGAVVLTSSNNNLGVGTASPAYPLHVTGAGTGMAQVGTNPQTMSQNCALIVSGSSDGWGTASGWIAASFGGNGANGSSNTPRVVAGSLGGVATVAAHTSNLSGWADLFVNADPTMTKPGIVVKSGGNVGVGTTTPASPLDVNGSAIVRGTFTLSNIYGVAAFTQSNGIVNIPKIVSDIVEVQLYDPTLQDSSGPLSTYTPSYQVYTNTGGFVVSGTTNNVISVPVRGVYCVQLTVYTWNANGTNLAGSASTTPYRILMSMTVPTGYSVNGSPTTMNSGKAIMNYINHNQSGGALFNTTNWSGFCHTSESITINPFQCVEGAIYWSYYFDGVYGGSTVPYGRVRVTLLQRL